LQPLNNMIDIHCHPLHATDDGPKTFEVAVEMCRMAAADGVTDLVATPHCNYEYPFHPEENRAKLAELQAEVGNTPNLLLGCDFHLSYENIRHLIENRAEFTINHSSYVLVEFDEYFVPEQMDHVFYELQVAGLTPIVTHPERNPVCCRKPEVLYHWVTRNCLVQVTAQSYTGGFGRAAQRFAEKLLDQNLIHFFASDAHDTRYRPPVLSRCYQKLAAARGKAVADLLLNRNPEAVVKGLPLPPGPPPLGPDTVKKKRSWFSFFR
jgi:protein-tyrosine phosphatase